ncbi:MAG: hypothetical protein ACREEE_13155, partial [Dongiaceae bacterium]
VAGREEMDVEMPDRGENLGQVRGAHGDRLAHARFLILNISGYQFEINQKMILNELDSMPARQRR